MGGASEGAAVQGGGHLLRGTTASAIRKSDRHSKVYTSRGPRDRRVRLSAYTAIQFYDVQDRLGYDRPSKAIDWLISKARNAIEKLNESLSSDNCVPPTMAGSNSNTSSAAAAVDHLSLSRGSETPPPPELLTFYYPDNSHLVSNPAICFPGFSGEEVPRDLGLSLYTLKVESDNKPGNSSHHHRHTVNPFDENFVMSSQEVCLQGVPLSNAAGQWNPRVHNSMDQPSYHHVGGRQSWYLPAPFYADEEAERDARS